MMKWLIVFLLLFAATAQAGECQKNECFDEHRGCFPCR
jgi:hypothetical protein